MSGARILHRSLERFFLSEVFPLRDLWVRSQNSEKRLLASSCLSVLVSVCPLPVQLPPWNNWVPLEKFSLNLIFDYFFKIPTKIQDLLKSDKNNGYFT